MKKVSIVADMARRHSPHDVYDLWIQSREACVLFGWRTAAGGNRTFCVDGNGELHQVAVPRKAEEADRPWSVAVSDGVCLRAKHLPGAGDRAVDFRVECWLDDEMTEFCEDGASLCLPTTCFDAQGRPWVAMVKTEDVENVGGVIDQHNYIVVAHRDAKGWHTEQVADLAYGLLPKTEVWGYPGKRRRPYVVPDDCGAIWVLWERKEPHDAGTRLCSGALLGRRFVEGQWSAPVRIVEEAFVDYTPDEAGVTDGRLLVAAQRGVPYTEPGRGEVVVFSAEVEGCPVQPEDTGFAGWKKVNLGERGYFIPANRELVLEGQDYELLFGDPHTHTALSKDAEGDLVEMIAYARDKAQIDFVAITDNDCIYGGRLSDNAWRQTMVEAESWSEDRRFIVIPAYEWTQAKWGPSRPQHRSILFGSYHQPMLRWADAGIGRAGDAFDALVSWIESTDGIMNTQHAQFLLSQSEREANMEVVCGWADYINSSDCFHDHLDRGFQVGFIGSSDGHRRTPGLGGGLTGLWVRDFTLAGIMEALRDNRCYATAGARIGLKFWVNNAFMGQQLEAADTYQVRVAVEAPRRVQSVEVFGDGRVLASLTDMPARFDEVIGEVPACRWYYARITMPGGFPQYPSNIAPAEGPWAWSSPVFVQ